MGAVARGAAIAGALALACGLTQRAMPNSASLSGLLFALILVAMGAGGYVAAQPQLRMALTAGSAAAALASVVLMLINVVAAAIRGSLTAGTLVSIVLIVLICTSAGTLGGYVAFRRLQPETEP